jgi:hypothetical protein
MAIKFLCFILFQFFLLSDLVSQNQSYVSLSIGTSIPMSPFSNDDTQDRNAGLAKIGGVIQLKYVRKIPKEGFAIALLVKTSVNGLNPNSMIDSYYGSNPDTRLDWQKEVKGWRKFSIQPGIIHTFQLNKKIQMESGVFIGAAYAKSPEYILKGNGTGNSFGRNYSKEIFFEQRSVDAFAFTASLQGGLKFPVNKKSSIIISMDYDYLKPTFKGVEQKTYGHTVFESGTPGISIFHYENRFDITQNMNTINLNVGLAYKF